MLVHKVGTVELHQIVPFGFAIEVNGMTVRKSQDLDALENLMSDSKALKEIRQSARQLAKHAKINKDHETRLAKARSMSRNEFIAQELIAKTKRSNDDRLVQRKDGNFDIQFCKRPTWSNIQIDDIEIWTGRTGLCNLSRDASRFWMGANV